jgi:hypothetical protein
MKGYLIPPTDEAIQTFLETEKMLIKEQDFLGMRIDEAISFAIKNGTKNKRGHRDIGFSDFVHRPKIY